MTYNNMGSAYSHLKKFDKAISSYSKALQMSSNYRLAYMNLFELQLINNQPFNQILEAEYIKQFSNKKKVFIKYEMLKILQNITNNQEANVEKWQQKYKNISLGDSNFEKLDEEWKQITRSAGSAPINFDELDAWVAKMKDGEVKERLVEALGGVFLGHGK